MKLLFICSRNQWRSPTAEAIYKNTSGFSVKSAGTAPSARIKITEKLIGWADIIFCMEKKHEQRITEKFPEITTGKTIVVLDIADKYQYMDKELVESINVAVAPYI